MFLELYDDVSVQPTIYILQQLNMLSSPKINHMVICYDKYEEIRRVLEQGSLTNSRLKALCVSMSLTDGQSDDALTTTPGDCMNLTNQLLHLLLQSCPNLEYFDLQGNIESEVVANGSSLSLSFINHPLIKVIRLSVHPCQYYILNGDNAYICYNGDKIIKHDSATNPSFHINLDYESKYIRLDLLIPPYSYSSLFQKLVPFDQQPSIAYARF